MPTTAKTGKEVLDQLIKEAAEQNKLAGLVIRVPKDMDSSLTGFAKYEGRNVNGSIMSYNGVQLEGTLRIQSFADVEVYYDKENKENRNNG
jgi:hypothetical protein